MKAATRPAQRRPDARLLVVHMDGTFEHMRRTQLVRHLSRGDLVVANDAATIPASLTGSHRGTGRPIEVRLAGRRSLAVDDVSDFTAIVFGAGDYRTRTEFRASPPVLTAGDSLALGPLHARVLRVLDHPRFVSLRFDGTPDEIWGGIARHGRPIQYAHVDTPLAMWDGWTRVAGLPAAFEPPSATFVLDWAFLERLGARGVGFATLTHAAGISSTGDPELDAGLPWDEAYRIPESTAHAISRTRTRGGRVVAIGSSVTRALEHAASGGGGVRAGSGVATQRIGAHTKLRVVDAVLSGAHEPEESHYQLLRAFQQDAVLHRMTADLNREGYHSHEYGDSVLVQAALRGCPRICC